MEFSTAQKVNIICSEGDVLLRGDEEGSGDQLLVSSHVLSEASENLSGILRTLCVPKARSFASTNEVTLLRNSSDALLIICSILHGRD